MTVVISLICQVRLSTSYFVLSKAALLLLILLTVEVNIHYV